MVRNLLGDCRTSVGLASVAEIQSDVVPLSTSRFKQRNVVVPHWNYCLNLLADKGSTSD